MKHWKIQDYCRMFPISFVLRSFYISRKSIANMLRFSQSEVSIVTLTLLIGYRNVFAIELRLM